MDQRSVCLLITTLVLAAAIVFGWLDYRAESAKAERDAQAAPAAPPPPSLPGPRRTAPSARPDRRSARSEGPGEAAPEEPSEERPPAGAVQGPEESAPLSAEEIVALRALEDEIAAQSFASAREHAGALAGRSRGQAARRARAIEAKARVCEKLVPPAEKVAAAGTELLLSNQNRVTALEAVREPGQYRVKLPSGVEVTIPEEDVLEVRPLDPQRVLVLQRERLLPHIEKLRHPIDIYVRGVRKLYQAGLSAEGMALFEKLIRLPESEQVALVFGGASAEQLHADWLAARGDALSGTGAVEGARPGPAAPVVSGSAGQGASESGPAALASAQEIFDNAKALYRGAFGKDGREDDLRRAYDMLLQAQDALDSGLRGGAASDEAHQLRLRVGQLLVDVGKSLPFE
jgi:hypothetical protein